MAERDRQRQVVVRRAERPGDLGSVAMAHGEVYNQQFGWDTDFEALVANIVTAYTTEHGGAREAAWIAEVDSERAGCIFCVAGDEPEVAELRILLVTPAARGLGVGTDWSRSASTSRARLGTARSACGPTTCSHRPGASTRPSDSPSATRNRTTASRRTSSARTRSSICQRPDPNTQGRTRHYS